MSVLSEYTNFGSQRNTLWIYFKYYFECFIPLINLKPFESGVGKENKIFIKILKGPNGTIGLPSLSFPWFLMILMVIIKMVIVNIVIMILIRL